MSDQLIDWLASVSNDPLAFVMGAFPWGEEGTALENEKVELWQVEVLTNIRDRIYTIDEAIKIAVASGHGIGKSALVSWIILWGFTTLPDTRGRVTAGTETQLKTVTWAEVGKWFNMFIGKEHFRLNATALLPADVSRERTWRIDVVPWSENNPQAFAGMHNKGRRIIYIFDEGSTISDVIYETAEGALTDKDTQIVWAVFGNPTRNSGRFREIFPSQKHHKGWNCWHIDSRTVDITNKKDIEHKIEVNGEDSDYTRIRILGQFPRVGELEFFSLADIEAAMTREAFSQITDPLAIGVDVARFGANASVIFFRKGRDGRSLPRERYQGMDTVTLASKVFSATDRLHANGIFVDGGGVGGGVVDNLRNMHLYCFDVQFGGKPTLDAFATGNQGEKYANKRAEMYGAARAWIRSGGALPYDPELKEQLMGITYTFNRFDAIQLTSKEDMMKDGKPSPDDADAFVLTFAHPLPSLAMDLAGGEHPRKPPVEIEYDPFSPERMVA